jgi:hypothetical protein
MEVENVNENASQGVNEEEKVNEECVCEGVSQGVNESFSIQDTLNTAIDTISKIYSVVHVRSFIRSDAYKVWLSSNYDILAFLGGLNHEQIVIVANILGLEGQNLVETVKQSCAVIELLHSRFDLSIIALNNEDRKNLEASYGRHHNNLSKLVSEFGQGARNAFVAWALTILTEDELKARLSDGRAPVICSKQNTVKNVSTGKGQSVRNMMQLLSIFGGDGDKSSGNNQDTKPVSPRPSQSVQGGMSMHVKNKSKFGGLPTVDKPVRNMAQLQSLFN